MNAVAPMLQAARQVASGTARSTASMNLSSSLAQTSTRSEAMLSQSRAGKIPAVSQREISDGVADALNGDPRTDKELARDAEAIPRTVRAWRQGENLPSLPSFFRLCWEIPELRAMALRWLESERTLDPDHERLTMDLQRVVADHLGRRQRAIEERGAPE